MAGRPIGERKVVGTVEQPTSGVEVDASDAVAALLVTRVEARVPVLHDVRVTVFREDDRGRWDEPTRARLAATLSTGAVAVVDGRRRAEQLAEQRWLAWFPRPFGPHHAVNVADPVVGWVTDRVAGINLVRAHLAARSWRAELLQAAGSLAATDWGRRRIDAWVARGGRVDDGAVRWACLVEATAGDDDVARAWAWGRGPRATASGVSSHLGVAELALPDPWMSADDARAVLDALAEADVLAWSVTGPGER